MFKRFIILITALLLSVSTYSQRIGTWTGVANTGVLSGLVADYNVTNYVGHTSDPEILAAYDVPDTTDVIYTGGKIYIDPDAAGGGDGSLATPFDGWDDVSWADYTAYLQKRGTSTTIDETPANTNVLMGAYGTGADPILTITELDFDGDSAVLRDYELHGRIEFGSSGASVTGGWFYNNELDGDSTAENGLINWSEHIKVIGNEIHHMWSDGIYGDDPNTYGEGCEYAYNWIYKINLAWFTDQDPDNSPGDCIQIPVADTVRVHHNTLDHSYTGNKFSLIVGNAGDVGYFGDRFVIIEKNLMYIPLASDNGGYGIFTADSLDGIIRYNVIEQLDTSGTGGGMWIGGFDVNTWEVYENIISGTGNGMDNGINVSSPVGNLYNNTLWDIDTSLASGWNTAFNNIIDGYTNSPETFDASNIFVDDVGANTLFNDTTNTDFRLVDNASAIDIGATYSVITTDLSGISVPQNSVPDAGVSEYTFTGTAPDTAVSFVASSPNKDSIQLVISGFDATADSFRINYGFDAYPTRIEGTLLGAFGVADTSIFSDTTFRVDPLNDTTYWVTMTSGKSNIWTYPTNRDTVRVDTTPPFSPADLANLEAWYMPDVGQTGDPLSAWADQSGNSHNLAQSEGGSQPIVVADALNGYTAIDGDGSADFMYMEDGATDPDSLILTDFTVFIVGYKAGGYNYPLGYTTDSDNYGFYFRYNQFYVEAAGDDEAFTITDQDQSYRIMAAVRDGSNIYQYQDGVASGSNPLGISDNMIIDQILNANGTYSNQHLVEVIIYSDNLSDEDRGLVETYLNNKYLLY